VQQSTTPSIWALLKTTVLEWNADNAVHLSAALAYYTIFAMAPLLVFALSLATLIWGREVAQGRIAEQLAEITRSPAAGELAETIFANAMRPGASEIATLVSFVIFFYAATGIFAELRSALNLIWDVPARHQHGIWRLILGRLITVVMVLVSGLIMLASLIATTLLASAANWVNSHWPGMGLISQVVIFLFFLLMTVLVFALIYRFVPDVAVTWHDVWIGSIATAVLFSIGRWLIGIFLSRSTITTMYGAAGSLIVILIWIYYSAQIFFLGAEFTQVYGRTYGTRRRERDLLEEETEEKQLMEAEAAGAMQPSTRPKPATDAPAERSTEPPPEPPRQRWGRRVTGSLVELGLAVGVIAVVSVYNLVREPFRDNQ
jgi:membrane protein